MLLIPYSLVFFQAEHRLHSIQLRKISPYIAFENHRGIESCKIQRLDVGR